MNKISKDQMGANAPVFILLMLKKEEFYGYSISKKLEKISTGKIKWQAGSLYPLLKKMEEQKLIKSEWFLEEGKRPVKKYKILKKGLNQLDLLMEERNEIQSIIDSLL